MSRAILVCVTICTAALAGPRVALADPKADQAKAKAKYEEGLRHYNLADYPQAIAAWREAYLLSKAPILLFNLGQAYRLSSDCTQAMRFYENYKREEPDPKNKAELEDAIKLCAAAAATKPDPVKPDPVKPDPVRPDPIKPDPGKPDPVDPEPAKAAPIEPDEPDEPDEVTATAAPGRTLRIAGIGVGGAGVLLGAAAIYFGVQASAAASDLDGFTGEWGPAQQDRDAAGKRHASRAVTLGAVSAGAILAGGIMYFLGKRAGDSAETLAIAPTAGGLQVGYVTRF